ncbi:hypothetical protein CLIM01_03728 [Colletotrichum limetticola]|uniref:Uncharacterized protein n=1 Tax=Colletotrichum limetticola TaxID=1209924 RepID=A0ABQ9Q502_9PEZI|nr:hypothetical protein CLIM01_03728 [Colletotrichum limetticola]
MAGAHSWLEPWLDVPQAWEGNFWAGMEGCPEAHGTATVDDGPSAVGRAVRPLGDRRDPTFNLFTRARVPYPVPRQPGYCLSQLRLLFLPSSSSKPWTWEKKRSMLLPMPRARRRYATHGAKTFDLRSPLFLFGP